VRPDEAGIVADERCDGAALGDRGGEVAVRRIVGPRHEQPLAQVRIVGPVAAERIDLPRRHAAVDVGAHVVRLGRRGVVDKAADVAVVVLGRDLGLGDEAGVAGHRFAPPVDVDDLGDVLGPQVILRLALAVFSIGVDEEDVLALGAPALLMTRMQAGMPVP
jgi:hypothetical protein